MWVRCGILALLSALSLNVLLSFCCAIVNGIFPTLLRTLGVGVLVSVTSLCTIGVGVLVWIGLSMVAVVIEGRGFGRGVSACRAVGVTLSFGGAVVASNVTRVRRSCCSTGASCLGMLFSSSSIFSSASISVAPLTFLLPFNACVRSSSALTIVSAGVTVG